MSAREERLLPGGIVLEDTDKGAGGDGALVVLWIAKGHAHVAGFDDASSAFGLKLCHEAVCDVVGGGFL